MIRVIIEIVPGGDEQRTRLIGVMDIARTSLNNDPENYTVDVTAGDDRQQFIVSQHHYIDGAFDLVRRALEIYCKVG